jgi:uncharacterized protein (TIGR02453 family)
MATYITPELFEFLRELKGNNNKEWFAVHKSRYEKQLREPLLAFISDFGLRLPAISPHYVADPRKVGGSLFRIYRDVRFSRDKTPYKTGAGIQFRHERGKDAHAPGFYLHLEPDNCFMGAGIWHPDNSTLGLIRESIVADPQAWQAIKDDKSFADTFQLGGESLKRPPKGYDADHPQIVDLKRKDFVISTPLTEAEACRSDFIDMFTATCETAAPFVGFLTRAVGLAW